MTKEKYDEDNDEGQEQRVMTTDEERYENEFQRWLSEIVDFPEEDK